MKRAALVIAFLSVCFLAAATDESARDKPAAEAFLGVASVLKHPRCMNCHPAGDRPLQGDDQRLHSMNVLRGPDGHGTAVMRCTNCHQSTNSAVRNAPPGVPDWHMPPQETPMTFQGLTAAALCARLKDPLKNGGRGPKALDDHLDTDLVRWAWQPGPGRSTPPLSYEEFRSKFRTWIDNGCGCPQ